MDIISPPDNIIFEDSEVILVLSYDPISLGHVVIKPKSKYKDLDELPKPLLDKIMLIAQVYVRVLKKKYNAKGYSIMQNGGAFNDTGHFHLHVFPRFNKVEFSWTYSDEENPKALEYRKIRDSLVDDFNTLLEQEK